MAALENLFNLHANVMPQSQSCLTRGLRAIKMEVDTCVMEFAAWKSQPLPHRTSSKREGTHLQELLTEVEIE